MGSDGRNFEVGASPILLGSFAEYPVSTTYSDEGIVFIARRKCDVRKLGLVVTDTVGAGSATGNISFGRRRAGSNSAQYFVANFTLAANTAQGTERWTDIGTTKLSWASTADTDRERLLNVGDVVTINITGVGGLAGKFAPLYHIVPVEADPIR